jgi:2-dehydro-3-deoxygluconokinase
MNKSRTLFEHLKQHRLIALFTPVDVANCTSIYEILKQHNVILEVAFRSVIATEAIRAIMEKHPDALILAGTVMTPSQAEAAIAAGAAGVVSADYIPSVVETCVRHDIMCVPGGLSDAGKQLVQKAEAYGCGLDELRVKYPHQWIYKLFPAVTGSKSNVEIARAWRGPYKDLTVIHTGGVMEENLEDLIRQDPEGIFCASALVKNTDQPDKLRADVARWVAIMNGESALVQAKRTASIKKVTPTGRVVTFGEIMLRLSPPDHRRFVQANSFDVTYGGAEANVAVALANFGLDSCFVTAIPDNEICQAAVNSLRSQGVDTRFIQRKGDRIGIYYLEHGAAQRPSQVIYDRAGSAISQLKPGQIDWKAVFDGASWFHWTGITPALSDSCAVVIREALESAKLHHLKVSVDLNYRRKLWSEEKARSVMTPLMEFVDVCICNEEDTDRVFGIKAEASDVEAGKLDAEAYESVARQLMEKFGFGKVAITLRESLGASDNIWSGCLWNGEEFIQSRKYQIHVVDRVGAGDTFSAGLIYGCMTGKSDRDALEFAVAASCLKHAIPGDFCLVSVDEVERLAGGSGSGRIQR